MFDNLLLAQTMINIDSASAEILILAERLWWLLRCRRRRRRRGKLVSIGSILFNKLPLFGSLARQMRVATCLISKLLITSDRRADRFHQPLSQASLYCSIKFGSRQQIALSNVGRLAPLGTTNLWSSEAGLVDSQPHRRVAACRCPRQTSCSLDVVDSLLWLATRNSR